MARCLFDPLVLTLVLCCAAQLLSAPFDDLRLDEPEPAEQQPPQEQPIASPSIQFPTNLSLLEEYPSLGAPASGPGAAAVTAYRNGDMESCLTHLRAAVAKDPSLPPPKLMLAGMHERSGNVPAARQLLEQIAAVDDTRPELYLTLANIALSEGRLTEALLNFQQMERLGPPWSWSEDEKLRLELSVLDGKSTIAQRRGKWDAAQEHLAGMVELRPADAALRDRWAAALHRAGHMEKAFDQFDIAYQQDQMQNRPEVSMGVVHVQQGNFEDAGKWYLKALEKHPDDAQVHLAWSIALLFQDRAEQARQHAERAAELGLDSTKLHMQRGMVARHLGKQDEAVMHFTKVLQQNPDHDEANYQRIVALSSDDRPESHQRALKLAEEFFKQPPPTARKFAAIGAAQLANGQRDDAVESLRRAMRQANWNVEHVYLLGLALEQANRIEEARRVAQALRSMLSRPQLFVARSAAEKWVNGMLP